MNWNPHLEAHHLSTSYPYNSAGSFMEYVEGLTYDHVNFIFDGATHVQENIYPLNASYYKFGLSDAGSFSYYNHGHVYSFHDQQQPAFHDHQSAFDEYRRPITSSSSVTNAYNIEVNMELGGNSSTTTHENPVECLRRHPNGNDYQVVWQDTLDPDNMTYEELLELGETVGTQNRGLSQDLISLLPVSIYKCSLFTRKKSGKDRCVICQMEYKRRERLITLPCKHAYHVDCGTKWLSINKACPICYTEVFGNTSKR